MDLDEATLRLQREAAISEIQQSQYEAEFLATTNADVGAYHQQVWWRVGRVSACI